MTGEELEQIYKLSGMSAPRFGSIIGVSKATVYLRFKDPVIEKSEELMIINNPTTKAIADRLSIKLDDGIKRVSKDESNPNLERLIKVVFSQQMETEKNGEIMRQGHSLFMSIVKKALNDGVMIFDNGKKLNMNDLLHMQENE